MGLNDNEVVKRRAEYGTNEITKVKKNTFVKLLLESLGDPIIKILLMALAIKVIVLFRNFDWYETIGILIAILLASFISTISEYGSEQAFNRLQEESSKTMARVKRNGIIIEIPIGEIVVGDIVILSSGDKVPADGYLVKGNLSLDESALNGETKEAKFAFMCDKLEADIQAYIYRNNFNMQKVNAVCFADGRIKEMKSRGLDRPDKFFLDSDKKKYSGAFLDIANYLDKLEQEK